MRSFVSAIAEHIGRITFTYISNGESINCHISREALVDREGASAANKRELRALFDKYEDAISKAVARKIAENDFDADGSVCVKDLESYKTPTIMPGLYNEYCDELFT